MENHREDDPLPSPFEARVNQLFSSVLLATRATNAMHGTNDHEFLSSFTAWSRDANAATAHVATIIDSLQTYNNGGDGGDGDENGTTSSILSALAADEEFDAGDAELFSAFSETIERLLDEAELYLAQGDAILSPLPVAGKSFGGRVDAAGGPSKSSGGGGRHDRLGALRVQVARDASGSLAAMVAAPKPQAAATFRHHAGAPPDNSRQAPFVPRPFDGRSVAPEKLKEGSGGRDDAAAWSRRYPQPFREAIDDFRYLPAQLLAPPLGAGGGDGGGYPRPSRLTVADMGVGDGSRGWTWVDSEDSLAVLAAALKAEAEGAGGGGGGWRHPAIAMDLEHHSYRSFQGLTCLLQLSTSSGADFVVDCLSPAVRPRLGACLGPICGDPAVVKVLHGANSDVKWLQRDFGIYLVNLFDTGVAATTLRCPSKGLAYLLQRHAGVDDAMDMKKKYQTSDWRQRPLSPEMLLYARSDTHYLLHVYDELRRMLASTGGGDGGDRGDDGNDDDADDADHSCSSLVRKVLDASRAVCRPAYEKERFDPNGWRHAAGNAMGSAAAAAFFAAPGSLHQRQVGALWDWRDRAARDEDESPQYVMSNKLLFRAASAASAAGGASSSSLSSSLSPGWLRSVVSGGMYGKDGPPLVAKHAADIVALLVNPPDLAPFEWTPPAPEASSSTPAAKPGTSKSRLQQQQQQQRERYEPSAGLGGFFNIGRSNSLYTFTPTPSSDDGEKDSFSASAAAWSSSSSRPRAPSGPVLHTEELYRPSGWLKPAESSNAPESSSTTERTDELVQNPFLALVGGAQFVMRQPNHDMPANTTADSESASVVTNADDMDSGESGLLPGVDTDDMNDGPEGAEGAGKDDESDDEDDFGDIPKSLSDIYKISNRNRRRAKISKSAPTSGGTGGTGGGDEEGGSGSGTAVSSLDTASAAKKRAVVADGGAALKEHAKRQKGQGTVDETATESVDFLAEIGWIAPEHRQQLLSQDKSKGNAASSSFGVAQSRSANQQIGNFLDMTAPTKNPYLR